MIVEVFDHKPVIGIAGGIGSGKTFVAGLFGELGCMVFHADEQVRAAYLDPDVIKVLRDWWGSTMFRQDGTVDKSAVAARIFADPVERSRLESLVHPWVVRDRDRRMAAVVGDPAIAAFVWDTPLLFETGADRECDAVVFVEAPAEIRASRVKSERRWDDQELFKRENLQIPLDKKRLMSQYVVVNTAEAGNARQQVRTILSRILTGKSTGGLAGMPTKPDVI
jgi:dephospho-CoA kinase